MNSDYVIIKGVKYSDEARLNGEPITISDVTQGIISYTDGAKKFSTPIRIREVKKLSDGDPKLELVPMEEILLPVVFHPEEIDNILVGCLEGGSNYWIDYGVTVENDDYKGTEWASHCVSKGGVLLVHHEDGTARVTKQDILKGITQHISKTKNADFESYDATDYDSILQYAIFGKLIYG